MIRSSRRRSRPPTSDMIEARKRLLRYTQQPVGNPDGCWVWTGPTLPRTGTPIFCAGDVSKPAWEIFRRLYPEVRALRRRVPCNERCVSPHHDREEAK